MGFVLVPFWSSGLVRTYAWIVILGRQGIVNTTLIKLRIIDDPLPFLGTHAAVVIGLTYYLLPYMILCLFSVMNNIDRSLLLAARNLGASPMRAFFEIFVPLTRPGVFAGSFLVFMLTASACTSRRRFLVVQHRRRCRLSSRFRSMKRSIGRSRRRCR